MHITLLWACAEKKILTSLQVNHANFHPHAQRKYFETPIYLGECQSSMNKQLPYENNPQVDQIRYGQYGDFAFLGTTENILSVS